MNASNEPIWRDGGFHPDEWIRLTPDAAVLAGDYPLLVPLAAFLAEPDRFLAHEGPLGVEVAAGEFRQRARAASRAAHMIALAFPKFSDGRSYSAARLLRERLSFKGELRAVGDVLADQIPLMRRCGIDSFEVTHAPTRAALLAGKLAEMHHYLPADPDRPARSAGGHAAVAEAAGELKPAPARHPALLTTLRLACYYFVITGGSNACGSPKNGKFIRSNYSEADLERARGEGG